VLYVRDAQRHKAFYEDVLGFRTIIDGPGPFVFMRAPASENHHDIAFFTIGGDVGDSTAGKSQVGMYHLAWEVATLAELDVMHDRLVEAGVLIGMSDHGANKSLYATDPDGLEFEVMWLVPSEHWGDEENVAIVRPLVLANEHDRFDAIDTEGANG